MMTTNLFVIVNVKQLWTLVVLEFSAFFRTFWGIGFLNSAIFKLIRNTKHFPLNLQSGLTLSNFRDVGGGFELRNQIRHCKTVCIKRNLYLINYNRMRKQWTTKGNRDAGSSCLCDRGLHQYLQNFGGGGFEHPKPPLGTPLVVAWQRWDVNLLRQWRNSRSVVEPGSLPCSQQTAIFPYPEPDLSSPYFHLVSLGYIFLTVFPCTLRSVL